MKKNRKVQTKTIGLGFRFELVRCKTPSPDSRSFPLTWLCMGVVIGFFVGILFKSDLSKLQFDGKKFELHFKNLKKVELG